MSDAQQIEDSYGNELTLGNSLDTLRRLRAYYTENESKEPLRYFHCRNGVTRNQEWFNDLPSCDICNEDLWKYQNQYSSDQHSSNVVKISIKKHMRVVFMNSERCRTCYGLGWCFNRIDWDDPSRQHIERERKDVASLPDLEQIVPTDTPTKRSSTYETLDTLYGNRVEPFLKKWMFTSISRENLFAFLNDFENLNDFFVVFDQPARQKVKKRILHIIGVNYE